ncbi:Response regulator receiver domain-containing protein [Actinacidiphila alni]|uniref:Response regulator receiver domain-containing protein n=1 Tax=Actinacidiphila alni TaxID=380248 RepID=A0A1I1XNJ8_9ACTN|nr:response regulator [Actinacidiphila alni]SFE08907.1 Response regulator receiver domain-containing protein [Actinacidiphila alni]
MPHDLAEPSDLAEPADPVAPSDLVEPAGAAAPSEDVLAALADTAVRELVGELTVRFARAAPDDHPAGPEPGHGTGPGPGAGAEQGPAAPALARLRVLAQLARAVDRHAAEEAVTAARLGANYPRLGQAWGITRQGARRRWPGLVFTSHPPSRPLMIRSDPMNALSPRRTYSVLLVEDDPADAMLIEEALSAGGMTRRLSHVGDGIEALEFLRDPERERPDLIVLDLNMPRMNGREFLGVLQEDSDLASIPLVVLTTSAAPDDIADAYRKHANAYVTKPVNLDEFLEAVQRIDAFFLETSAPLPAPGE